MEKSLEFCGLFPTLTDEMCKKLLKKAIREQNQLINGQMFIVLKILLATHMQIPDTDTAAQRYIYLYIVYISDKGWP